MSTYLQNPTLTPRALETEWMNNIVSTHQLICSCEKPFKHLEHLLKQQDNKWRLTEEDTGKETTQNGDDDVFTEGDLNALFEAEKEDLSG